MEASLPSDANWPIFPYIYLDGTVTHTVKLYIMQNGPNFMMALFTHTVMLCVSSNLTRARENWNDDPLAKNAQHSPTSSNNRQNTGLVKYIL